jgi:hypothetical protein
VCILNADDPSLDTLDLVASVAELENVTGKTFDGKILAALSGMVPPEVSAVSRPPRRARRMPLMAS